MKHLILVMILLTVPSIVIAHDGSSHTTDLELWVSATGLILIGLAIIYRFVWMGNPDSSGDDANTITNSDNK